MVVIMAQKGEALEIINNHGSGTKFRISKLKMVTESSFS